MKKGLRRSAHPARVALGLLEGRPDEEGIETPGAAGADADRMLEGRPDEEGIETGPTQASRSVSVVRRPT